MSVNAASPLRTALPGRRGPRGIFLLALAAFFVCASPWGFAEGATGKYGTPLRFDPPPVDLGAAPKSEEQAPPEREKIKPDSQEKRQDGEGKAGKSPGKTGDPSAQKQPAAKASSPVPVRLFGTVEFRSPIKNLPKWERVLNSERKSPSFTSQGLDTRNKQVAERWARQKDKLKDAPLKEQVQRVNNFFNQWPYKTDREVWGVEDYWATPREFVSRSGDCEDYAISKYYALRDLGVPPEKMRIVAIKDVIRNIGHAILLVFMENDAYVLDNLTNLVLSHKKLTHYAPQYSVNEIFLWRHVQPKSTPAKKK